MKNMGDVRVVLVSTSLPANIGSAARAMKTMGFGNLYLVKPKSFPSQRRQLSVQQQDRREEVVFAPRRRRQGQRFSASFGGNL